MNIQVIIARKVSVFFRLLTFKLRDYYYRRLFDVGSRTVFWGKVFYYNPHMVHIGKDCSVNEGVFFNVNDDLHIGDNVTISANVFITTVGLDTGSLPEKRHTHSSVCIGSDAWIGACSTLLPGVIVGDGAVVAAGSVVTGNVEPGTLVAGVPAKMIRRLKEDSP